MQFVFEQHVRADRDRVFAFFARPGNLEVLHRDDRSFRLLRPADGVAPGGMTWVAFRVGRILPVVLGFRHDAWDPPHWFTDRQVHGPFARFTHRHEFAPTQGGTLVRDVLDMRLPRCYGGEAAMRWFVAPALNARFRCRGQALARIFAAPAGVTS